jgi:FkbM family methyltransferase
MNNDQIQMLRTKCASVQLLLSESSPLNGPFEAGSEISLRTDGSIFPHVAKHQEWNFGETRFIQQACVEGEYHLIDVGANVGLYSRQALINYPNIKSASCFEPSPDNVEHLKRNLKAIPAASVFDFALGTSDGELTFYIDEINGGNFSFNENAVTGRKHHVIKAPVRRITEKLLDECMGQLATDRRVIWKSDTQGLDEVLMSELPLRFWQRVDLAVFEGWRIPKPTFDTNAFRSVLDSFDHIYLIRNRGKGLEPIDASSCIEYLSATDRKWGDIYMSCRELH